MHKKILLLVGKVGENTRKFVELVNKNISAEHVDVEVASFSALSFTVETGKINVRVGDTDIRDFSLVYIRRAGITNTILANTLGICLRYLGVPFFDSIFGEYSAKGNKLRALVQMAVNQVRVPKTIYFSSTSNYPLYNYLACELGSPFIAKDIGKQRGKGVYLISSELEYADFLQHKVSEKTKFIYQKFIDKSHEYRVVVMGEDIAVWYEKFPSDSSEFRYNSALGAKEVYYDVNDIPVKLRDIALNSSKCLKQEISGVDVLQERVTNELYVLEANRSPGFDLDESLSPEVKVFADFLMQKMKR